MLKNIISKFQEKHQDFDFNQFLYEFEQGKTREELMEIFGIKTASIRKFVYELNLDFVKSRRINSIKELRARMAKENGQNIDLVEELESEVETYIKKTEQLYKSLTLVRDDNNRLRKEHRNSARSENVSDILLNDFRAKIEDIVISPNVYEIKTKPKATQRDGLVLVLSDQHSGSVETSDVSNNNYNYDVMERRLSYMVDKTLANPFQSHNLVVLELLDILSGIIHSSEYLSEDGFTTSMLKVVEVYTDVYSKLAPAYDKINVYVTGDNHSRITQKPTSYMKWDNLGSMCMKMLEMVLKAKGLTNIHFHYTKNEYHMLDINGSNILAFHGDTMRRYNPSSQAERANLQSICLGIFGNHYKFAISGHIHRANQSMNEYGGYNITNGTLVGNGQYGVSNGFASIRPSQTILYFDEIGNIEQTSFVDLGHIQ